MQRRRLVVVALLCGLGLSGCGQPLPIAAGNSAAQQTLPTATVGVRAASAAPELPSGDPAVVSSADPNAAVPEASAPVTENLPPTASDAPPAPTEAPAVTPTVNPEFAGASLPRVEDRWRYIQLDRTPFDTVRTYTTSTSQTLWWYDPRFGQNVRLGDISGDFPVQATFRFRGQEISAFEVPYEVNKSFGFTLPDAILNRMRDAGVGDWAETFVYESPVIQAK